MSFRLTASLALDVKEFSAGLRTAAAQMNSYAKRTTDGLQTSNTLLRSHSLGLKDTARIVQGIMISQVFYGITRAISDATSALWEFNKELDYTKVTYSALFGSSELASDFLTVLQEHAVQTIYSFQDLADASKKLLAYGIEYKNLMFIMEGLTNLGAMSGDSAATERIARALGQIYTKGTLKAEEMRQLADAYVPIYDIIQSSFGLTEEQMGSVGDLKLPAANVINAIVDYANEKFGDVGDAAMLTITGLESRIKDTMQVLGTEMLGPLTKIYKSFLVYVSEGLDKLRTAYADGGVGGIFEHLVPDKDTQTIIRQFVANLKNMLSSIISIVQLLSNTFGNMFHVFVTAFNIMSPIIISVANTLAVLLNAMLQTTTGTTALRIALTAAAAAFLILKVHAISSLVITVVTKAVVGLTKALAVLATLISKHPILMLVSLLGAGLIGIAASSDKANNAISRLFGGISKGVVGSGVENTLQKVEGALEGSSDEAGQFNERLKESAESASELSDRLSGAGKAAKKAKDGMGLLSFDEVFKLPEPSENSSDSGSGGLIDDLSGLTDAFGGLSGALDDALDIDIPDFSEIVSSFKDDLLGPLGSLVPVNFGNTFVGGILGSIIKAFKNTKLRDVIGQVIVGFADDGFKGILTALSTAFKSAGGLKGIIKGGVIGAVIGFIADTIAGTFWEMLAERFESANTETAGIGQTIAGLIGTLVGAYFGGPVGAALGSVIGTFVGGFIGLFWEPIKQFFIDIGLSIANWATDTWTKLNTWWNDTFGGFFAWCTNTKNSISQWWTDTKTTFSTWWEETTSGFSTWWEETTGGFSKWWEETKTGLSGWWKDTIKTFSDWESINGDTLSNWWTDTKTGFDNWIRDTKIKVTTWALDTYNKFITWKADTKATFELWKAETFLGISVWVADIINKFTEWKDEIELKIRLWAAGVLLSFINWAADTKEKLSAWFTETKEKFTAWVNEVKTKISNWVTDVKNVLKGFGIAVKEAITKWFDERKKAISDWFDGVKLSMSTWFAGMITDVAVWFGNLFNISKWKTGWSHISAWFEALKSGISVWFTTRVADTKSWWEDLFDTSKWRTAWSLISGWFTSLKTSISNWFSGLGTSVSTWWSNLWDGKEVSASSSGSGSGSTYKLGGHATGGIFTKEHIARFAEGGKAEAVIPLENQSAMQPFVNAISEGLLQNILPSMSASGASSNALPPLYVGTLIADERGLQELFKKFEVYEAKELARKGAYA